MTWQCIVKHPLPLSLLLAAVLLLGHGAYIQTKAVFAQWLIAQAWQQTLSDQRNHRPWQWADTYPVAKLSFVSQQPKAEYRQQVASLYVLAGATGRTLAFGPGLLLSGAPVGQAGNTVIAGHRDTHFAQLAMVNKGDLLQLQTQTGEQLLYQVVNTLIADQSETQYMAASDDNRLTLITCYPFSEFSANAQQRYIVEALLVDKSSII